MESKSYDITVIGAGASGLMAAIFAAGDGAKVAILEKNDRAGRKIRITGKGRCNITNTKSSDDFLLHVHQHRNFFNRSFEAMNNLDTVDFFNKIGLPTMVERGDRVFPQSENAQDVTDALVAEAKKRGVEFLFNQTVTSVGKDESGFNVKCGEDLEVITKALIVCTGGLSYQDTGSTGDGYAFAKSFGIPVTECFPSLTALMPEDYDVDLVGLTLKNVEVKLFADYDNLQDEFGDLDFTDDGIEGPLGYRISRKAIAALRRGQKVTVVLDLKPALYTDVLDKRVETEAENAGFDYENPSPKGLNAVLKTLLPQQLIKPFLRSHDRLTFDNMADALKTWTFTIVSYYGYKRSVVTAGGVDTSEIIPKSMECRNVPGLYFAGEVLDIDGDTGGYNLQIAFTTGAAAGGSAAKKLKLDKLRFEK
jgi:predicted Rossmann fold flavoprotein